MNRNLLPWLTCLLIACSGSRGERIKSMCITNDECGADAVCENGSCVRTDSASVEARAAVEGAPPNVRVDHQVVGDEICRDRSGDLVCELARGGKVVLVAPEVEGYRFVGWAGAAVCKGSERVLSLENVVAKTDCTARYVKRLRVTGGVADDETTLVNASSESPFAECEQNSCVVDQGQAVRLVAPERDGYRLASFAGEGCSPPEGYTVLAEPTDADVQCTATYVESLTVRGALQGVEAQPDVGVSASSPTPESQCNGAICAVDPEASVVLVAPEIEGYRFRGWIGSEQCVGNAPELTIDAVRTNLVCTADYVRRFTVLAKSAGAQAEVTASADDGFPVCEGARCEVDQGSTVTLIAKSVAGYRLRDWEGEGCAGASGASAIARDVQSDVTCTANYVEGVAVSGTVVNAEAAVTATSTSPGASCADGRCNIDVGGNVTLTAPTLPNRTFRGWSGDEGCTGTARAITLANVTESRDCRATFAPRYQVQGRPAPTAGGSVSATSNSANARCANAACEVDEGGNVTLTARASANFRFTAWSGGGNCTGSAPALTLNNLRASITCNANFVARIQVSGVADPDNAATIAATSASAAAACQGASCTVDSGSDVMLRATAAEGYRFARWSGCGSPNNPALANSSLLVSQPTSNERCVANLERIVYTVAATAGTGGSVRGSVGNAVCSNASCRVPHGESVSFEATPATGYTFAGWTNCANSDDPELTLDDVSEDQTCRASFERVQLTVAAIAGSGGTVSASTGGANCPNARCTINYGANVTVTATALTGAEFVNWSGCSNSNQRSITLNNVMTSQQCTANFRGLQYTVRSAVTPANSGSVNCANGCTVQHGQDITLTASPNSAQGYRFAGWTDCTPASQNPLALNDVTSDRSCTARFERIPVTASVTAGAGGSIMASSSSTGASCNGNGANASCSLRWGDSVRFTAQPTNDNYQFVNWSGGGRCSGTSPTLDLGSLTGNVSCTANFQRTSWDVTFVASSTPATVTLNASGASCGNGRCTRTVRASDSVTTTLRFLTPVQTNPPRGVIPVLSRWEGCTPSSTSVSIAQGPRGDSFDVTYTSTFSGFRESATCTARIVNGSFVLVATQSAPASVSSSQGECGTYPAGAGAYAQVCLAPAGATVRISASEALLGWKCVRQNIENATMNDDAFPDSGSSLSFGAGANELMICAPDLG